MKLLWQKSPQTAQELVRQTADWSESTVKTLLNRLVRKEAARFEVEGKAYRYFPKVGEAECRAAESASFLKRVFGGAFSPMLAHFVESHELSEAELAELERLVKRKRQS